jgi:hypothetical protein
VSRTVERLVDLAAMLMLLTFCYLFRVSQPALAGMVVGAAIQFWMAKNAASPDSHKEAEVVAAAAATAAAAVLKTAAAVGPPLTKGGGE